MHTIDMILTTSNSITRNDHAKQLIPSVRSSIQTAPYHTIPAQSRPRGERFIYKHINYHQSISGGCRTVYVSVEHFRQLMVQKYAYGTNIKMLAASRIYDRDIPLTVRPVITSSARLLLIQAPVTSYIKPK